MGFGLPPRAGDGAASRPIQKDSRAKIFSPFDPLPFCLTDGGEGAEKFLILALAQYTRAWARNRNSLN